MNKSENWAHWKFYKDIIPKNHQNWYKLSFLCLFDLHIQKNREHLCGPIVASHFEKDRVKVSQINAILFCVLKFQSARTKVIARKPLCLQNSDNYDNAKKVTFHSIVWTKKIVFKIVKYQIWKKLGTDTWWLLINFTVMFKRLIYIDISSYCWEKNDSLINRNEIFLKSTEEAIIGK